MPIITTADASYSVAIAGAGAPLMLLHGFTGSAQTWASHQAALSQSFRMIMPDLLGHGGSDSPAQPARYEIERCTADLMAILDAVEVEQTSLLGYSMGGRAALAAAIHYPERITSLILESASPGIAESRERQARIASDNALANLIERDGLAAFVDKWEQQPLFETQLRLPQEVRAALREQHLSNNPQGLANSLRGLGTGVQQPLWERLGEIGIPVLLIAGELDNKFVSIAYRMARAIAGSRLALIPGAGHAVHLEQPVAFDQMVLEFLKVYSCHSERSEESRGRSLLRP